MDYGQVAGLDKPISRIVFGGDRLAGGRRLLPTRSSERRAFSLLDWSFELGCNTFDTARMYGDSERTLGAWIRKRRNRDEVVVISKGCHPDRRGRPRLSPAALSRDLHASLKALGTDRIDLYFLHYDDPGALIEPVLERLNRHIEEGKVCAFGASNWSLDRIACADTIAADKGMRAFAASSVQFSLVDWTRSPWPGAVTLGGDGQRAAREWYSSRELPIFAWSSLARGFFSDHYNPATPDANRVSRWCATYFGSDANHRRLERALTFAREHDVTVAQVALAYVLCQPLRPFAVVGCSAVEKFAENVGALPLKLDGSTLEWLATGQAARC